MSALEDAIKGACEEQKPALRRFAASGRKEDAAEVHYESCLDCTAALEAVAVEHARHPPPILIEGSRRGVVALFIVSRVMFVALVGFLAAMIAYPFFDDDARAAAEGMQGRVRFVRMPNRTDVCVAGLPGNGGYGPVFVGSASCRDVADRVAFDEDMSFHLGRAVVVRIRGTQTCLASVGESQFTLPCRAGDD